jgi:predicted HAD superfamily Cof-like phosphohydrolase
VGQIRQLLSVTARSNLYTMHIASQADERQAVPHSCGVIPPLEVRKMRAKLLLEEYLETIHAMGLRVACGLGSIPPRFVLESTEQVEFITQNTQAPDLEKIVDGACDTIYVATGLLMSCGVPDVPHLDAVALANAAKFRDGQLPPMSEAGKYLKPAGWRAPDHQSVSLDYVGWVPDLCAHEIVQHPERIKA